MACRVYWSKTAYQQSFSDCERNHKKTKIAFSKTPLIALFYITTGKYEISSASKVKRVNGTANAELVLHLQIFPSRYKTNLVSLKTSYEITFDKYSEKIKLKNIGVNVSLTSDFIMQSRYGFKISSSVDRGGWKLLELRQKNLTFSFNFNKKKKNNGIRSALMAKQEQ